MVNGRFQYIALKVLCVKLFLSQNKWDWTKLSPSVEPLGITFKKPHGHWPNRKISTWSKLHTICVKKITKISKPSQC